MKAAVFYQYGPVDVLEIADIAKPEIGPNDILVRVHAASVNPKDTFIRKGRFKRFTGKRFPQSTGMDYGGEVAAVGRSVNGWQVGEAVYGMLDGWRGATCAEFVLVKPGQIAKKPITASFEEAAALPLVSLTALQALRDNGGIQDGYRVCINGAAGGVGSMAVQIAKIHGAHVTATSSRSNHDFLRQLGADACIDYHEVDITQTDADFDIFFDVFGNTRFQKVKPTLTKQGVWISTVLQPHVFMSVAYTLIISQQKAKLVRVKSKLEDLDRVRQWIDGGQLKPIIHQVYALTNIREAHAQQETRHTQGKIVISI